MILVLVLGFVAVAWITWRITSGPADTGAAIHHAPPPIVSPTTPSGSSGGSADASGIAAAIDPSVVDIVTTLGAQQASAAGTGIVLTASGEVLTNNHVINGATRISVTDVGNGQTYDASVVGYDRSQDLAVIRLKGASGLATAPIGDSRKVVVGDAIVAIGNAGGRGGTPAAVTGNVTGLDQTITASDENGANSQRLTGLIQVAAAIEPGDSGGPLVDRAGRVIGIDTAATASFRFQEGGGEGFAIPINQAMTVAKQIETGRGSATVHIGETGFLGVAVRGDTGTSSVVITAVVAGSPADRAGLSRGDQILSLDGTQVDSPSTLTDLLIPHHPGDQVRLSVLDRNGKQRTLTLRLATGPAA
jgi:S1-C subfamily serine protease